MTCAMCHEDDAVAVDVGEVQRPLCAHCFRFVNGRYPTREERIDLTRTADGQLRQLD